MECESAMYWVGLIWYLIGKIRDEDNYKNDNNNNDNDYDDNNDYK